MTNNRKPVLALFYCQNVPDGRKQERQSLEKKYGGSLRLFPIPCSGRLDPIHLLRALEEFADAAYVITCPEGACRNFEGNRRAGKRMERTRAIIRSIGLEPERVGMVMGSREAPKGLPEQVEVLMESIFKMTPSPVHHQGCQPCQYDEIPDEEKNQ
ncbi:MAG: hydrogenase iron-sulfur subunit [Desulfatiglandaceae bacterium]|jgi:F420-non-reducing hydrogenase iron-sulfur subunit